MAEPLQIRVTDHSKMNACVAFALSSLEANESRPLVFHTLPVPMDENSGPQSYSKVTSTIPRLISIVEIVKREFVKALAAKHSPRLAGLHQYNELGCLEDLGIVSPNADVEMDRATALLIALDGKNHPKQRQTPYMKITLSHRALPDLVEKGATYQPPTIRKLTKSAKARLKKRERSTRETPDDGNLGDADAITPVEPVKDSS